MTSVDPPRVFVGLDGSLPSLRALRWAVWEARRSRGEVHAVHVRPAATPEREIGLRRGARRVDAGLDRQSEAFIATWVHQALGEPPCDVVIRPRVVAGRPGPTLASLAWRDSDLLVVGTDKRPAPRRLIDRSVGRYCVTHADCPVLVVPPDSFARTARRPLRTRRGLRRRDPWKQFDAATGSDRRQAH
jgi:nucleotide-binding universal stress UspA family protein